MRAFEQVLEMDAEQTDALEALAELYTEARDGERLITVQEKQLGLTKEPEARRKLMFAMAAAAEQMLKEPRRAFEWCRRAYHEQPDEVTLGRLEEIADLYSLWEDLISVYLGEGARSGGCTGTSQGRAQGREPVRRQAAVAAQSLRSLARSARTRTGRDHASARARAAWPPDRRLARAPRRLRAGRARAARHQRPHRASAPTRLRARENDMKDASGAFDEHVRAFLLDPESETSHQEILRLAEVTGRWEDALNVEGQLFARAEDNTEKIVISKRAADLVETKIKDDIRAFRAYLGAFRLAPEDESTIDCLWRLAEKIGTYTVTPAPAAHAKNYIARLGEGTSDRQGRHPCTGHAAGRRCLWKVRRLP